MGDEKGRVAVAVHVHRLRGSELQYSLSEEDPESVKGVEYDQILASF